MMREVMIRPLLIACLLLLAPFAAVPHEVRKDPFGCHEVTESGEMHCHDKDGAILPWPPVKKSRNDICHDRDSPWYDRTIHLTPFITMKECLDGGCSHSRAGCW
ncbi:MAG: hypothetical protein ACT4UP_11295 [Gammaproteobacteria bacterium]